MPRARGVGVDAELLAAVGRPEAAPRVAAHRPVNPRDGLVLVERDDCQHNVCRVGCRGGDRRANLGPLGLAPVVVRALRVLVGPVLVVLDRDVDLRVRGEGVEADGVALFGPHDLLAETVNRDAGRDRHLVRARVLARDLLDLKPLDDAPRVQRAVVEASHVRVVVLLVEEVVGDEELRVVVVEPLDLALEIFDGVCLCHDCPPSFRPALTRAALRPRGLLDRAEQRVNADGRSPFHADL